MQVKTPAGKRPELTELSDREEVLSRPATAAEVELCPEENQLLVYRAEAPRPSSVDSSLTKTKSPSSSMMTTRHQTGRVRRGGNTKAGVGAELGPSAKTDNVIDATPLDLEVLPLEAVSSFEVLKVAVKAYCFVRDAAFSELKNLHELETGCALSEMMNMVIADPRAKLTERKVRPVLPTICSGSTTFMTLLAS